jgi:hypothetical protein
MEKSAPLLEVADLEVAEKMAAGRGQRVAHRNEIFFKGADLVVDELRQFQPFVAGHRRDPTTEFEKPVANVFVR